ncbi:CHAT domain-containing protein [Nostoc sp. CENA67]|uniref:CHAT domain-containing protein n=1 Tax=Amazonocrinis nigriterrae CENA67 TaxID=2794033 RepID=A0A8J7HUU9_9NOST|nr:CHAT domain-containing tetratricopeptide repeat protein [Amazonocrinis nigriterrae]MBH8566353.1 CHAT domain-containing protein [Amazonocrinis nigriterrae CENA67]
MNFLEKLLQKNKEQIATVIVEFSRQMLYFPLGSKAKKLEITIAGYQVAQRLYAHKPLSKEWAYIQNLLGYTYSFRMKGERAENFELAIEAFKLALQVRTRENYPKEWAETQINLGITYCHRIRGNKANNLRKAIKCFKLALKVCTPKSEHWAKIQNELGNAYLKIEKKGKVDSLLKEAAINAFTSALNVFSNEEDSYEWATTQKNLGNAYRQRKEGNKDENLEKAIKAFESTLKIFDKNSNEYGRIKNNLGIIYLEKRNGDKKENLKCAIQAFKSALKIYVYDYFPQELAITLASIGKAYLSAEEYTKAYEAFADTINIVDFLRLEIIFGSGIEFDKQNLAEKWNPHYQGILEACLNLAKKQPDYFAHAIEYAERSKARNLVELLNKKNLYPIENCYSSNKKLYQIHCRKLNILRIEILNKQWQKQSKQRLRKFLQESNEPIKAIKKTIECINKELEKLMQKRDNLIQKINKIDPNFKFTQKLNEISFSEIKALVGQHTAIIEWYITNNQIITFIITHNEEWKIKKEPPFWASSSEDLDNLIKWCKEYFEAYYAPRLKEYKDDNQENNNKKAELKKQWEDGLTIRFQQLAEILHINDILSHIPKTCDRLILVPHRFLHLLPLHALPLSEKQDQCLLDKFKGGVGYAPSCQLLQISQGLQRTEFRELFAIQNPKNANLKSLDYAKLEVDAICKLFSDSEVLKQENASEVALKESDKLLSSHCCHFACHGKFDLKSPVESALLLAEYEPEHKSSAKDQQLEEDGRLTLREIFELTLDQCRLVTLSACETGMVDPDSISDEYIGLPSGFMFAGSPSVVASLWRVDDISTAFLMSKFYENLTEHRQKPFQPEEGAVAIALNQAQCWLRDVTNTELMQRIENLPLSHTNKVNLIKIFNQYEKNNEKPFYKPYYWAAFCAIGK